MIDNYSLPIRFEELSKKNPKYPKIKLEQSIRQHIYLILTTRFGSYRFDPNYGCVLWEHDFEHVKALRGKNHFFENSIKEVLAKHEPRLTDTSVSVGIDTIDVQDPLKTKKDIKKRISIQIKGRLVENNKPFEPKPFIIFFSPATTEGERL